jgi:thiosulfate dehydrogenase
MGNRRQLARHGLGLLVILGLLAGAHDAAAASKQLQHAVNEGRHLFATDTFGGNGMTCNTCHRGLGKAPGQMPNGARFQSLIRAAAIYPRYKARLGHVVTLDDQVRGCIAGALQGKAPAYGSPKLVDLISYLGSIAKGQPIDIGGKPK